MVLFVCLLTDLGINADVVEKKEQKHPSGCGVGKRDTKTYPHHSEKV